MDGPHRGWLCLTKGTGGPDWQGWRAGCGPRAASWTTLNHGDREFVIARCYDHEFVIASPIVYDHGCVPIRQRHHGCDPIGAVIIDVIHL